MSTEHSMAGRWDHVTVRTRIEETKWVRLECESCDGCGEIYRGVFPVEIDRCNHCAGRGWCWKEDQ